MGNNMKIDLKGIKCMDINWIYLAQNRGPVVGSCVHDNESFGLLPR
jgi:hypothetical protein